MKNILNKKVIKFLPILGIILLFNSCKSGESDVTPNPTPTVTDEMYIQLNGLKVICKLPASQYHTFVKGGDTCVDWWSGLGDKDTILTISHSGPRISGMKYKVEALWGNPDEVGINLRWSVNLGHPDVVFDGGDYTLEKIKGKWVSTMKNGTGYDSYVAGKRYSGIEFRLIWP